MKATCVETKNIKNPDKMAMVIYKNFGYLKNFPELSHNPEEIKRLLTGNQSHCLFIYNESNEIIAYLIGEHKKLNDGRLVYYISYIYVSSKYRKKGLGSDLVDKVIKRCENMGINFIILTCDIQDENAYNFYRKLGFVDDPVLGSASKHRVLTLFLN